MKKLFLGILAVTLSLSMAIGAQTQIKATQSDETGTTLVFKVGDYELTKVQTSKGTAYIPSIKKAAEILKAGFPAMLHISESIVIPDKGQAEITIIDAKFETIQNIEIAPSKGNLYRNVQPSTIPFTYGEIYNQNTFYPETVAELGHNYILRDFRGQAVWVNPMQYNPVTKELRVYTEITVKISTNNQKGENEIVRTQPIEKISAVYNQIYANQFANYNQVQAKYTPISEEGNMLIIAPSAYLETMASFVAWKNQIGIPTELVELSEIGTTASQIETYIENYYNTTGVTFVLLIGDDEHVTATSTSYGDSDAAYGYMAGNDTYAEIIIGRFSGSVDNVAMMVQKTIAYEQTPVTTDAMYDRFALIASAEGGGGQGDDGESDVQHMRNIKPDLTGFTYTTTDSYEFFDGTNGEMDAPGDPTATNVVDAINNGVGVMGYVGHGSDYALVTTDFGTSNFGSLTNTTIWPFMFDVACVNGNFVGQTCFAEGFIRATHNGEPAGVLAICASTINQSWAPPMSGEDEMFDLLVNSYTDNIKHTFGGIHVSGCMQMNDDYGAQGDDMTDTWTIFGDPSVMLRTATPTDLTINADPVIFLGSTDYAVTCDTEGARATLTIDGQIVASAKVEGGVANLTFDALTNPATATLTVVGFNKIPATSSIQIIPAEGPYMKVDAMILSDVAGNNNQLADYGETISLSLDLKNVGSEEATNLTISAASEDVHIELVGETQTVGTVGAESTISITDVFEVTVSENAPDQHKAIIVFTITDGTEVWTSNMMLTINAPIIELGTVSIAESIGNGNGNADPGEVIEILVQKLNNGHSLSQPLSTSLVAITDNITVIDATISDTGIEGQMSTTAAHKITIDTDAAIGSQFEAEVTLTYLDEVVTYTVSGPVGLIIEDFESAGFESYEWVNDASYPWTVQQSTVYEGTYAAKSGDVGSSQSSQLSITIESGADDQISFMVKPSSEGNYDFLQFYIDGAQMGEWSGNGEWTEVSYDVTAGEHTFMWKYEKDNIVDSNDDCGYIDYIIFPGFDSGTTEPNNLPVLDMTGDVIAYSDRAFNMSFTATDADDDALTFSCSGNPAWMTMTDNGDGTATIHADNAPMEAMGQNFNMVVGVSDGKGFVTEAYNITVMRFPVGIENTATNNFNVYPNPTAGLLNINFTMEAAGKVSAKLYSVDGKMIKNIIEEEIGSGAQSTQINVGNLQEGIYYLNIVMNNNSSVQKIVIAK